MNASNLLTPWLLLGGVLLLLVQAEKWIQSHLYGVGWLLTNDKQSATVLYYLILAPGVFVHEFTQWLVAGALNVPTRRVMAWPEAQEDGTLRLDFVQIQGAGWLRSALIGAFPFIVGTGLIWLISNEILNLQHFFDALATGDITLIGPALREVGSTPDFYLWLYLLFAISNAMLPTPADRKGWPLLIGVFAVTLGFLILIGVGQQLYDTFTGPVAHGLNVLTAAFSTVLAVEVGAIFLIGVTEEVIERLTKRKFQYMQPVPPPAAREPGSNLPLPPGTPPPSIYNLELPLPNPSAPTARPAPAASSTIPAPGPPPSPSGTLSGALTDRPRPASRPGAPAPGPARSLPDRQPSPPPVARPTPAATSDVAEGRQVQPRAFPRPGGPPQPSGIPAPTAGGSDTRSPFPARPLPGAAPERGVTPARPVPAPREEQPGGRPAPSGTPRQEAFLRDLRRGGPSPFDDDIDEEDEELDAALEDDDEDEGDDLQYIDFDDL